MASHTIVSDLPLPWVCQMIPPSRRRMNSCAATTPKYWFCRHTFLMPASKTMKSWISGRNLCFAHNCSRCRSSRLGSSANSPVSSTHESQYFSGVSMVA